MKNINVIYTLEVQDGEHRYNQHSPQTIQANSTQDIENINREGEALARNFIQELPDDTEPNSGDWYEIEGGSRAIRYKSFEVIEDEAVFKQIQNILYK
jgi:hypothetical protein